MADPRIITGAQIPSSGPTTRARLSPERSEATRAAQRAFFEAALNKTGQAGAAQPTAKATEPTGIPASSAVTIARTPLRIDNTTPPTRMLRPGSLLDITV